MEEVLNTVINFKPVRLWVIMRKVLFAIKWPFAVSVVVPIVVSVITSVPVWLGVVLLICYGVFFLCVILGAVGRLLNNRKIKKLCRKIDITVKEWNIIREIYC